MKTGTKMENSGQDDGRLTDDLPFTPAGAVGGFARTAEGTVSYVPVSGEAGVLGYLWWSDAENAAGFQPRPASGNPAFNAASYWTDGLHNPEYRNLTPSRVVAELARGHGGTVAGHVVPGPSEQAASREALKEIAGG